MNLLKFEPLKRFFTVKKSNTEVELLKAQVRMLQNTLHTEVEECKKVKLVLFNILKLENINMLDEIVERIINTFHLNK